MLKKKLHSHLIPILFAALLLPSLSLGRENNLQSALNVLESYDSNPLRNNAGVQGWTTTISPSINFLSQGQHDIISFFYAPGLRINQQDERETTIRDSHNLQINAETTLAQDFQLSLSETFILTNDPYLQYQYVDDPELGGDISEKVTNRTFWRNTATTSIAWNYAQESSLTLRGNHYVYEQKDDWRAGDYNRFQTAVNLEQRLTRKWHATLDYSRSKTDFEPTASLTGSDETEPPITTGSQPVDIENNRTEGRLDFRPSPHSTLSASGYLNKYKFDAAANDNERENYDTYHAQLGWQQLFGPHFTMSHAAGESLINWDQQKNRWSYFYEGALTVTTAQNTMTIGGGTGLRNRYYSGANDGLSEYWTINTSLDYHLNREISVSISGSYYNDTFLSRDENPEEELIRAGFELSYILNRWATLMLRYNYLNLIPSAYDGYKVHRLFLEVRASNELWRW